VDLFLDQLAYYSLVIFRLLLYGVYHSDQKLYVQVSVPSDFQKVKPYFGVLLENELQCILHGLHSNKAKQFLHETHLTAHVIH
jgi:hypothetical protein